MILVAERPVGRVNLESPICSLYHTALGAVFDLAHACRETRFANQHSYLAIGQSHARWYAKARATFLV
jgi:hypothetical protein